MPVLTGKLGAGAEKAARLRGLGGDIPGHPSGARKKLRKVRQKFGKNA